MYITSPSATKALLQTLVPIPVTTAPVRPVFEVTIEPHREYFRPAMHVKAYYSPGAASGLCEGALLIDSHMEQAEPRLSALLGGFVTKDAKTKQRLREAAAALLKLYTECEGKRFVAKLGYPPDRQQGLMLSARLDFDDWAFQLAGRHKDIHSLARDENAYDSTEVEAAKDGIVYLP